MLQLSHKTLDVYQIALKLVNDVYCITKQFPKEEQYVIVNQYAGPLSRFVVILQKEQPEYQNLRKRGFMRLQGVQQWR